MSKISAEQAEEQIRLLEMLGEADEALEEVQGYAFGGPTGPPPGMAERLAQSAVEVEAPASEPPLPSGDGHVSEPAAP
jgi:hypothetical protein